LRVLITRFMTQAPFSTGVMKRKFIVPSQTPRKVATRQAGADTSGSGATLAAPDS